MEEGEGEESAFWQNFLSRCAGVSWDEAETDRGKRNSKGERGHRTESAEAQAEAKEWFDRVIAEHYELGAGKAVGDYLRQVVERRGVAVALLT